MDIKAKIVQRIREMRENKNFSQKDLAYKADMDRSYLASVENGKRNISIVNLEKIGLAPGISLGDLFKEL